MQILVTHTLLSIYSSVINHPTAPTEVRHFFHAAGLSSALNVMRAAIQGEGQLSSMPNNTAIMISFAACFSLRLSGQLAGGSTLAPSVRTLIEETADVLERIGSATKHRNGMSALYGKYLKYIVKKAAADAAAAAVAASSGTGSGAVGMRGLSRSAVGADAAAIQRQAATTPIGLTPSYHQQQHPRNKGSKNQHSGGYGIARDPMVAGSPTNHHKPSVSSASSFGGLDHQQPLPPSTTASSIWSEPIQFSSMSDDQIVEALSRVNNEFGSTTPGPAGTSLGGMNMYPWDDSAALDWLNWSNLPEFGS